MVALSVKLLYCLSLCDCFRLFRSEVSESELKGASSSESDNMLPSVSLVKKKFGGKYAIASEEFTSEMVSV